MSLNKKTSSIWSLFTVIDDTHFAKCDICKRKYSFKTSVTNLKTHLAKSHCSGAELNLKWGGKLVKIYQTPTHPEPLN